MATAPVRNKNVLSGISPPMIVDASMMMRKTTRYIHIPYCRSWSEVKALIKGNWAAIMESTVILQSPLQLYEVHYSDVLTILRLENRHYGR
jgi:hypothetical protein